MYGLLFYDFIMSNIIEMEDWNKICRGCIVMLLFSPHRILYSY